MVDEHPETKDLEIYIIIEDTNSKFVLEPKFISGLGNSKDGKAEMIGMHLAHTFTDLCIMQAEGKTRN